SSLTRLHLSFLLTRPPLLITLSYFPRSVCRPTHLRSISTSLSPRSLSSPSSSVYLAAHAPVSQAERGETESALPRVGGEEREDGHRGEEREDEDGHRGEEREDGHS
ncbi:hypothetical protein KUCAC02_017119, partial [Chaenocephalus aceratus]